MHKSVKSKLMLAFILLASLFLVFALYEFNNLNVSAYLKDVQFEDKYVVGSRISIPDGKISIGEEEYDSTFVVKFPNGISNNSKNITLSETGCYVVVYSTIVDGKVYKYEKSFNVFNSLVSYQYDVDSAKYMENPYVEDDFGLFATVSTGNKLTFNKIINLNNMSKEDNIVSFRVLPTEIGKLDCRTLWFVLTDVYDSSNYILLRVRQDNNGCIYIAGRSSRQTGPYGINNGLEYFKIEDDVYGLLSRGNFYGYNIDSQKDLIQISFDISTKTAYSLSEAYGIGKTEIVRFDDKRVFENQWEGFTTGEVYLSVYADEYISSKASILFNEVAGFDLTNPLITDSTLNELYVDFGDYSENDVPSAIVDKPYNIFPAYLLNSNVSGSIQKTVYYAKNSSSSLAVQIINNCFIPTREGYYTIEYSFIDEYNRKIAKEVVIRAYLNAPAIQIEVDDNNRQIEGYASETIPISKTSNVTGGLGKISTFVKVICLDSNNEYVVNNNSFVPHELGNYSVIYSARDYVGNESSYSYNVSISSRDVPVFEEDAKIAKYLINNGKYYLPTLSAYDYSTGTCNIVECSIFVNDNNGLRELTDNLYIPSVSNSGDTTTIIYKAVGLNGYSKKEYTVPVIDTNLGTNQLNLENYFIKNNISTKLNNNNIGFISTSNSSAEFIKPLLLDGFTMTFRINATKNSANRINFYFVDIEDDAKIIKVSLKRNGEDTLLSINDDYDYSTEISWGGDSRDFSLNITGTILQFVDRSYRINSFNNGESFATNSGYTLFTFDFEFEEVGEMELQLKNLCGQQFSSKITSDNIPPRYYARGVLTQFCNDSEIVIPVIEALDVLNPYSEASISIVKLNGSAISSIDGVVMSDVKTNREYHLMLDAGTKYRVTITYKDGNDKSATYRYLISYEDIVCPEIELSTTHINAKLNESIKLPTAVATDNVTPSTELVIYKYVQTPSGVMYELTENTFTPTAIGEYIIRYFTFDSSQNITYKECKIVVY